MCRTTFETPWGKLQILLGMKLTTDVTWLLLSAVDNVFINLFFMLQVLTMTLTESTNICYINDTVKLIKKAFLGNNGFPANIYIVNGLQSEIKRPITWRIFYLVREGQIPVTLSQLWKTLGLMLRKVGIIKFDNPSWIYQNYFWNSLRQTSKFIWNEVDNWCNFTVCFSSR